ncbi:hypothetical protein [Mucilaginibacter jinjuensis]|uniref:Uncharacterized protein n=1 Tax=Mucilaginibacter jinjuensis TaxID=1176721 RepID=A0ABY7T5F9_9SPHI|nr:hypothetical protein [Mucilaginibacter jinjuensis]WCT11410.1 hypothetical protein PQO05_21970 [Mucilaginibacter jinjuensis]
MKVTNQSFNITHYKVHLDYLESMHKHTINQSTYKLAIKKSGLETGTSTIYFSSFYRDQETAKPFIDYYAIARFDFVLENEAIDLQTLISYFNECYTNIFEFIKSNNLSYNGRMSFSWMPFDEPKDFMMIYLKQFQEWPQKSGDVDLTFADPVLFPTPIIKFEHTQSKNI